MVDKVVLVNEKDNAIGVADKSTAHAEGKLHRAFSVLILNEKNELLLQQRAYDKYHSGGLWSNTCCGHPKPDESLQAAARRRLQEEMGLNCHLREIFSFIYRAEVGNGSVEYEYDHVLIGNFDGEPRLNLAEVMDWRWIRLSDLQQAMADNPEQFTAWLGLIVDRWLRPSLESDTSLLKPYNQ
jgi:isopentenyl-diphosphate delta-isomerase